MTILTIRRIHAEDERSMPDLCELLRDSVDNGASVGFLAPLSPSAACGYWEHTLSALDAELALWVAEDGCRIVGAVQLSLCGRANGLHRAEVQKLFVLTSHRGRGIASKLMAALEAFAVAQGRTLLVLDTQAGCVAEAVYRRLDWQRAGEIPDYAASPTGELQATALFYKRLRADDSRAA